MLLASRKSRSYRQRIGFQIWNHSFDAPLAMRDRSLAPSLCPAWERGIAGRFDITSDLPTDIVNSQEVPALVLSSMPVLEECCAERGVV